MPSRSASRPVHRYWVNVNGRRVRKTHGARRKQPPGGVRRQKAAGNGPATPSSSSPGPATSSLFVSPAAVVDTVVRDTLKKTFARRKAASKTAPVSGELRCNVGSANPAYEPPSKGPQTNPKYIQRRRDYSDTSPFATHFAVAHPLANMQVATLDRHHNTTTQRTNATTTTPRRRTMTTTTKRRQRIFFRCRPPARTEGHCFIHIFVVLEY